MYPYLSLTHHFQPVPGYSFGGTTSPPLLNPYCFQGSCQTLHGCLLSSSPVLQPVLAEGNQNEIQLNRVISIMKGCGEYAIIQPGCLAALCATGEENQSEKCMHQRDSSRGPLINLYRVCLEKSEGILIQTEGLKSGHSLHQHNCNQSTLLTPQMSTMYKSWWPHLQRHPPADCIGEEIPVQRIQLQWCKSRITSVVTHSPLYVPNLVAQKAFQMFRHINEAKIFDLWNSWVHLQGDKLSPLSNVFREA